MTIWQDHRPGEVDKQTERRRGWAIANANGWGNPRRTSGPRAANN